MRTAKVSAVYNEGRGIKRGLGGEEAVTESSRMARMNARARKTSGCSTFVENEGPVSFSSSNVMEGVMTRNMVREALVDKERRGRTISADNKRVYQESEVVVVDDEDDVKEKKKEKGKGKEVTVISEEVEEVKEEMKESEAIGEGVVRAAMEGARGKKVVDDVFEIGGVSLELEKKKENWKIAYDDWGWTWSCEDESRWWESICYPYWETMCNDLLPAKPDEEVPWDGDLWNFNDNNEFPKP
nr:hypothetical protein CFP56_27893 [Quercus suber]